MDGPEGGRRQEDRRVLALSPGADGRDAREPRARSHPRGLDAELSARGALRRERAAAPGARRAGAEGRAADGREPPRQRRAAAEGSAAAGFPRLRGRGPRARRGRRRGHAGDGTVPARRDEGEPEGPQLPPLQPGREQLEPLAGRARGHRSGLERRDPARRRPPGARRPGDGDAVRAPVPGLARGLSPHRPARVLLLLRGLHPHRRLDVQPAREVAEGLQPHSVAASDRLAELPALQPRLAAGPQRLQPSGSGIHRSRGQQEGGGDPRLPAAGCELSPERHRPLPAQPQLRQRDRGRQAAGAAVADDGRGHQALHRRHRHLGVGEQRQRRRARRGHGVLRGRADAGDAGRGRAAAPARAGAEGARGQRRRT